MKAREILYRTMFVLAASAGLAATSETHTFSNINKAVPDGNLAGLSDTRSVTSTVSQVSSVRVRLRIAGEFNGDLYGYVRHVGAGQTNLCVLINRPGRTASNSAGYADSGLDVVFDDTAANGDIHVYRSVSTSPAGSALSGDWRPDGRKVDPAVVADTSPRTTSLGSFAGTEASGEWTLYLVDAESGGTNLIESWGLEFSGAATAPISWPTPADIIYGTPLGAAQLNASSTITGTFSYNPPAGTVLNAGAGQTLSVTFTPIETVNYVAATTNVSITVLQKDLTVTADSKSKVYGAALPTLTASYSGLVNGDTEASLDVPVSLTTDVTAASPAGTYAITAGGAADANYAISYVAGPLTVTPAPLTITADNKSKIYGVALPALTASYSGFVNGDTEASLDTPVTLSTTATATSDVGTYPITAGGATDLNYAVTFLGGTLTITPARAEGILVSSANPALPGASVTFTCTLSAVAPGAGTPTGEVQFKIDGVNAGAPVPLTAGAAAYTAAALALGTHQIVAEYAGSLNFGAATATLVPDELINTPPVAGVDTIERWATNGTKVAITALLTNDTDADGDTITWMGCSPTSANGGTLQEQDGWVTYIPPAGFTNVDTFTYTISDGRGVPVTCAVMVTIKQDLAPAPNLFIVNLGAGSYQIWFNGIPGKSYRIQYAETLSPPNWQPLGSVTADDFGLSTITDTPPVGAPERYYRSVHP